jgi:ribokinase
VTAARVVIVGSVNRDLLLGCDRLPQPGETVTGATASRGLGGKGANAAVAVARLGGHAQLVALLGEDEAGAGARSELSEAGVDVAFVGSVPGSTGFAVVVTGASGENLIVVVSGANAVLDESRVVSALESLDDAPTAVLANLEVPLPAVEAASRAAEVRGWPFVLDPAPASGLPAELLRRCSVLVPNRRELKGLHPDGAEALLRLGAGAVVTTLGAEGAELATGEGTRQWPAPEVAVRDTVGAGDAFAAALALSLAEGTTLPEAVEIAVAVGALSTRGAGAQGSLPTRPELLACVRPSLG